MQGLLLLLVGGVLAKIVADGTYLRYVRPGFAPILLVAGLVIVALAMVALVRQFREATLGREGESPEEGAAVPAQGEPGSHAPSRSAWLLFVPALVILLIAPPALGSDALEGGASRTAPPVAASRAGAPLPPGEAPALAVSDLVARVAADPTGPAVARDVTLVGFLAPARPPVPGTDLARLLITCCAADASPVRVHLVGAPVPVAPAPEQDLWVRVRGSVVSGTGTRADGFVPTLRVTGMDLVTPPSSVYEY